MQSILGCTILQYFLQVFLLHFLFLTCPRCSSRQISTTSFPLFIDTSQFSCYIKYTNTFYFYTNSIILPTLTASFYFISNYYLRYFNFPYVPRLFVCYVFLSILYLFCLLLLFYFLFPQITCPRCSSRHFTCSFYLSNSPSIFSYIPLLIFIIIYYTCTSTKQFYKYYFLQYSL